MPNFNPTQSDQFKEKRIQRVVTDDSCIPPDTPLAEKALGVRVPVTVDDAIRQMGKQKAAWLREVICKAALEQGLIEAIE